MRNALKSSKARIYVTSKIGTPENPDLYKAMWRRWRDDNNKNIISRWIEPWVPTSEEDFSKLWNEIIPDDLRWATHLLVYVDSEAQLKGGLFEVGAMAALKKPIVVAKNQLDMTTLRKMAGTWIYADYVTIFDTLEEAFGFIGE